MKDIDWFFLSTDLLDKINVERKDVVGGMDATVKLSPFDVPIAIGVQKADKAGSLIISFQYLQPNEPKEQVWLRENVVAECGKSSKRVYSILVEDALLGGRAPGQVEGSFERALVDLAKKKNSPKAESYQAAKEALSLMWKTVFPAVNKIEPNTGI